MAKKPPLREGEIILYTGPSGDIRIEVMFEDESFWLTQKRMAELFDVTVPTVSYHLKDVFDTGELDRDRTVRKFLTVQTEGARDVAREVEFYNLDAIIAVGYRVNSRQATQFRIWSTSVLREFIIKGFVLDDERLKQGKKFGRDYFDDLLERIREIRASERRFYLKITDIYQQCSADYLKDAEVTRTFFATVQNKLHWAITGKTAAETIAATADAAKRNMGLQTWKNAPHGKILKSDVAIAKNYLPENAITALDRIVTMYLDYAENQARRGILMKMKDWAAKLDAFLAFNDYDILKDAGKVKHDVAKALAEQEYEKFRVVQDAAFEGDFEREAGRMVAGQKMPPEGASE